MEDISFKNATLLEELLHHRYPRSNGKQKADIVRSLYYSFTTGNPSKSEVRQKLIQYLMPANVYGDDIPKMCKQYSLEYCKIAAIHFAQTVKTWKYGDFTPEEAAKSVFKEWNRTYNYNSRWKCGEDLELCEFYYYAGLQIVLHLDPKFQFQIPLDRRDIATVNYGYLLDYAFDHQEISPEISARYIALHKNILATRTFSTMTYNYVGYMFDGPRFHLGQNVTCVGNQKKSSLECFLDQYSFLIDNQLIDLEEGSKFKLQYRSAGTTYDDKKFFANNIPNTTSTDLKNYINSYPVFFKSTLDYALNKQSINLLPKNRSELKKGKNFKMVLFYAYLVEAGILTENFKVKARLHLKDVLAFYKDTERASKKLK